VTSAFIEHAWHSNLNPMIPVIMINIRDARVCLDNAENDVLLISEAFRWYDKEMYKLGIVLLWAAMNHRYVKQVVSISLIN